MSSEQRLTLHNMKLDPISVDHISEAALRIDEQGVPKDHVWSQYYVVVNGQEYRFKQLLRQAYSIATGNLLNFQTSVSYKNYVQEILGFKLTYYEGGYNFFTSKELEHFHSIVGAEYRKDNPSHQYYGQKLYPIIAKANYWANQLLTEAYKLRVDSNWLSGYESKIAPYFWPRIYKGEDKDIFFNVEVNGSNRWIGYKLDGYQATKKKLPGDKLEILEEFKNSGKWDWPKISFDDINSYSWERLLTESRAYVSRLDSSYDHLKEILNKESKISRLTWNTYNWIKPSGRSGKSNNKTHESENGFGHEEWLFDGDTIIEGYKYGFLEPIHKARDKHSNRIYDITLFTRDADTQTSYWVARLKNVEVLDKLESTRILGEYKKRGWFNQMKQDLKLVGLSQTALDEWVMDDPWKLFNIRFSADQLSKVSGDLLEIEPHDEPSKRYVLLPMAEYINKKISDRLNSNFSFEDSGSEEAELLVKGIRKGGLKRAVELTFQHNEIQKKLLAYLQVKYGKGNVKRECFAYGTKRIDLVRKTSDGYIFYEIKTYNNFVSSLRESVGQLLEYSLYPDKRKATQIVLVSHVEPSDEEREYFIHLRSFISIPFRYIQFDHKTAKVITEIE